MRPTALCVVMVSVFGACGGGGGAPDAAAVDAAPDAMTDAALDAATTSLDAPTTSPDALAPADAGPPDATPSHAVDVVLAGAGGGVVISAPGGIDCGTTCNAEFFAGTLVALTALPAPGSTFAGWSGPCAGTSTCYLGADHAWTVTATFDLVGYELDVTMTGVGTILSTPPGIDCPAACTATFAAGTVVTLSPVPTGEFASWSGACTGVSIPCTLTMNGDKTVDALFINDGPTLTWMSQYGGVLNDEANALALDPTGGFAITGAFWGATSLGGATLSTAGSSDAFLAHYDAGGAADWSLRAGGGGGDAGNALSVAADGAVVMGGRFAGTANFGSGAVTAAGMSDGFVTRYAAGGVFSWARVVSGTGWDEVIAVTTLPGGDVVMAGRFEGTVDFGAGAVTHIANGDLFLVRLAAADGALVWARTVGAFEDDRALGLAFHPSGDLIVSGQYSHNADFGAGPVPSGGKDAFVARYTPAGALVWVQSVGNSTYEDAGFAVAVGPAGQIAVAGKYFTPLATPLPGFEVTWGNDEAFVMVLDESGAFQWGHSWGSIGYDWARDVAFDALGDVYLIGGYGEEGHFDGPALLDHTGFVATFVARYSAGAYVWAKGYTGTSYVYGNGLEVDAAGNVLVAGYFWDTADFDLGPVSTAGASDVFLLEIAP